MTAPGWLARPRATGPLAAAQAVVLVVLLTVGLISVASGGDDRASDTLSVVELRGLASNVRAERTARLALEMSIDAAGQEFELSGTGSADFDAGSSDFTLDFGSLGDQVGLDDLAMVVQGQTLYLRVPDAKLSANGGRRWVSAPAPATAASVDFVSDPTAFLDYFSAVGDDLQVRGRDEIRGVEATHYRASMSIAKVVEALPADQREQAAAALEAAGVVELPIDAWVDDDGLVRRTETSLDIAGQVEVRTRYDVYDYGTPVDIEIPAAGDVRTLGDITEAYAVIGLPHAGIAA